MTRRAIGYLLSQKGTGNAVAIVIGGAAESLSCRPGVTTLILKNRKGFVRMALRHGWVTAGSPALPPPRVPGVPSASSPPTVSPPQGLPRPLLFLWGERPLPPGGL